MSKQDNPTIGFVSLGCPKALVDSERIITQLRAEGYGLTNSYDGADLVVINTCGFIDDAIQESMDAIGDAIDENGRVIVTGCLGSRSDEIRERYPQVLDISGAHAYEAVMGAVHKHVPRPHDPYTDLLPPAGIKLTPRHYAYLKISEGCNHRCSFCIIPHLRGDLVSRPIGEVLSEAEQLQEAGVNELLIISQDTSAYGVDLRYRTGFWHGRPVKTRMQELCEALGEMDMWVRLHYVYPYPHVDNIIPLMNEGKILPYLDIPFQHASPRILKAMKRPAHADGTLERIHRWREVCPDLAIRSTFIVGFPGETEQDFQMLLDFLEEAQLDRVGCFTYSPVDGAPANDLPDHVPADVAKARQERLMNLQARISADKLAAKVGTEVAVIIDEIDGDTAVGRTHADAPEIDGNIILRNAGNLSVGEILAARVEHSDEHDLYGVAIDMPEEASA